MKIIVVGAGYVGLANAIMFAKYFPVKVIDVDDGKISNINLKKSPIKDSQIEKFLLNEKLSLIATNRKDFKDGDIVLIATPTDYDPVRNYFDTSTIDNVLHEIMSQNSKATIIIKSTVPVGYTDSKRRQYKNSNIIFSPEFLREGNALYDCLNPSRIVIGDNSDQAKKFVEKILKSITKKIVEVVYTQNKEAEAIKLFSNTYLAMRVAFFNELDSYAQTFSLSAKHIIQGVSLDERIGLHYNNPSFGYGGYCLPKDTKQLLANFNNVPNTLIKAIVDSNLIRKKFIVQKILDRKPKIVGIFRLIMKNDSDNFRSSAIVDVLNYLKNSDITIVIYEPLLEVPQYEGCEVMVDLDEFKNRCDLIVTNRKNSILNDVIDKVFTRDLYEKDF